MSQQPNMFHLQDHRLAARAWTSEVSRKCSGIETLVFENDFYMSSSSMTQMLEAIHAMKCLKLKLDPWALTEEDTLPNLSGSALNPGIAARKGSLGRLYIVQTHEVKRWVVPGGGSEQRYERKDCLSCLRDVRIK
jgi:hypothetical protein